VFGLAPTPILQGITQSYIFGFDVEKKISRKNFVQHDLTPEAQQDVAKQKLQELFNLKKDMKFDAVVGNPPYQDTAKGTSSSDDPIYHLFMDSAFKISEKTTLITPGRFLFNAGKTPKEWNRKILNDKHFKVLLYESDSRKIFPNVDIKGGVAVTLRDAQINFGKIELFTHYAELNSINNKVQNKNTFESIVTIIETQNKFNLEILFADYPTYKEIIGSDGSDRRLRQIIMERLDVFKEKSTFSDDYKILGLIQKKRHYRYIPKKYIG
jgi:hypothetical protein